MSRRYQKFGLRLGLSWKNKKVPLLSPVKSLGMTVSQDKQFWLSYKVNCFLKKRDILFSMVEFSMRACAA